MPTGTVEEEAISAFKRGDLALAQRLAQQQLGRAASPALLHLIGLIECRRGRPGSGARWLKRALDQEPDDVGYRVMLVRALLDSGKAEEALEASTAPPGTSPAELALWQARAEAADSLGKWVVSAQAWARLCTSPAGDWRAWSNCANAFSHLGRWSDSAKAFARAVELNSSELPLRLSLVSALARAGRFRDSADELGRCVEAFPGDAAIRVRLARLLADLGRSDEMVRQLDCAAQIAGYPRFEESSDLLIAIAAASPEARSSGELDLQLLGDLAQLLERSGRMDLLSELLAALGKRGVEASEMGYAAAAAALAEKRPEDARRLLLTYRPDGDPVRWHWLMARIADALEEPAAAFAEAEAMNRWVFGHDEWRERAAAHIRSLRALASKITPEWGAEVQTAAPDGRRMPAFLLGFPRSGTTLLDTFLMGHGDTHVFEEVPLIEAAHEALGGAGDPLRSPVDLARAREAYFETAARYTGSGFDGLIIDKFPLNMLALPFIHALFPGAPIIFAQRHPCDCVLSCFMQAFAMSESMACFLDIRDSAEFYDAAMQVWTNCTRALPLNVHRIVYEQLIADPEGSLRPLLEFLDLDWADGLLDHRATARARGGIGTPSYNQVTQPLSRSASGRWIRYRKQMEEVLPVLLPWAERLGY